MDNYYRKRNNHSRGRSRSRSRSREKEYHQYRRRDDHYKEKSKDRSRYQGRDDRDRSKRKSQERDYHHQRRRNDSYNSESRNRNRSRDEDRHHNQQNRKPYFKREKTPADRAKERVSGLQKILPATEFSCFLDVGCGNGTITEAIGKILRIPLVYGADVFPNNNVPDDMKYLLVQNNKIEMEDSQADLISCFVSIHHFEFFDEMMKEILRILKPDGYLYIREHDVPENNEELKKYLDEMHTKFEDHPGGPIWYWPRQKLKNKFEELGLKHMGDYDYEGKNPQAIYHSLFRKIAPQSNCFRVD